MMSDEAYKIAQEYVETQLELKRIYDMEEPYRERIFAINRKVTELQKQIAVLQKESKEIEEQKTEAGIPGTSALNEYARSIEKKLRAIGRQQKKQMRTAFQSMRNTVYEQIAERDGEQCGYCGSTRKLEVDHRLPLSMGGDNRMGNMQLLCKRCNAQKRDYLFYYYLEDAGRKPGWDWIKQEES